MTTAEPARTFRLRFKHYLLIAFLGLVALVVWVNHLASEAEAKFGPFAVACDGKPVTAARAVSSGTRGVAFHLDRERQWKMDPFRLPDELQAETVEALAFVVCLEPAKKAMIGRCGFKEGVGVRVLGISVAGVSTGGVTLYPRTQEEQPLRVVSAQTGQTIADGVVRGATPPECDRYTGKVSDSSFEGASVDSKALGDWLRERLPKKR